MFSLNAGEIVSALYTIYAPQAITGLWVDGGVVSFNLQQRVKFEIRYATAGFYGEYTEGEGYYRSVSLEVYAWQDGAEKMPKLADELKVALVERLKVGEKIHLVARA